MPSCDLVGVDDIEDIITVNDVSLEDRIKAKKRIVPKKTRQSTTNDEACGDSIIPGTQKIYVKTWGCSHNNSDSEYMAGQLASYGYKIIDDSERADLWLLNSCTVKNPAEDGFYNAIKKAQSLGKHMVLAGCVPQGQPNTGYMKGLSVVGVQQIDRVVEVVEEALKGHTVRLFGKKKKDGKKTGGASLDLPKIRKNPLIEIIAINTGCLNQCTYCKTKHARGELGSYPIEEIVARVKQSFEEGVVEVWLTSEDTGAYGKDIGVTLPDLLWQLVEVIPEGAMMRIGMTNPPYILEHLEEMAKILNHPRVYSFLHVPIQSASNAVLTDMKREYFVEDFRHLANFLKERVDGVNIATDIICGFPTETDADFQETYKLVEDYKFASLFINQFFPRPGTPAAKMQRIPADKVKDRTRELSKLFHSYLPYEDKLGKTFDVLVTEEAKDGVSLVGHNKYYDQVLLPGQMELMGKMVTVEIYETGKHFLKGRLLDQANMQSPGLVEPLPKGVVSGNPQLEMANIISTKNSWTKLIEVSLVILLIAIIVNVIRIWLKMSENS